MSQQRQMLMQHKIRDISSRLEDSIFVAFHLLLDVWPGQRQASRSSNRESKTNVSRRRRVSLQQATCVAGVTRA